MPVIYSFVSATALMLLLMTLSFQASAAQVPGFDQTGISEWKVESFSGETRYSLISEGTDQVLEARSDATASGLYYKAKLPVTDKTILSWRWKIENTWPDAAENTKTGDDFPVRVYIIVSDGPFFWQKRTLVYVWSNNQPINTRWANPYTEKAVMWAVDSGQEKAEQWRSHKRHLQNDFRKAFNKTYTEIEAIAIMTDSDNSGTRFLSWYDDVSISD